METRDKLYMLKGQILATWVCSNDNGASHAAENMNMLIDEILEDLYYHQPAKKTNTVRYDTHLSCENSKF